MRLARRPFCACLRALPTRPSRSRASRQRTIATLRARAQPLRRSPRTAAASRDASTHRPARTARRRSYAPVRASSTFFDASTRARHLPRRHRNCGSRGGARIKHRRFVLGSAHALHALRIDLTLAASAHRLTAARSSANARCWRREAQTLRTTTSAHRADARARRPRVCATRRQQENEKCLALVCASSAAAVAVAVARVAARHTLNAAACASLRRQVVSRAARDPQMATSAHRRRARLANFCPNQQTARTKASAWPSRRAPNVRHTRTPSRWRWRRLHASKLAALSSQDSAPSICDRHAAIASPASAHTKASTTRDA